MTTDCVLEAIWQWQVSKKIGLSLAENWLEDKLDSKTG
jgi:hypothetical protein